MPKYTPDDYYAQKARSENYKARSVYKLQEIDLKHHIVPYKGKVLDLGAAPGSWSQYVAEKSRNKVKITAFDLKMIEINLPNLFFHQLDITTDQAQELIAEHGPYDLIMSDMAPSTSGIRLRDQSLSLELITLVYEISISNLIDRGSMIFKFFESEEANIFLKKIKKRFQNTVTIKPKSTRSRSYELFFIGKNLIR